MLKFLIILLIVIYVWSILDKFIKFFKIFSCLDTLCAFLQSTSPDSYTHSLVGDNYRNQLNAVLAKYPDICEFTSPYSASLSYGALAYDNYIASDKLLMELLMRKNFIKKEFFVCLNPINAVKILISFPSSVFKLLGFEINPSFTKFWNLIGWLIAYFLGMYETEIKALINSLLKFH